MCTCRKDLKFPHCPDGKIADVLALTHACTTANASVNYRMYVLQRPCKVPIAPMGFSHVCACLCLQGGGVAVSGGTVSFSSCTIAGNTARAVRAHAQNFPSPRWEIALLTCPTESYRLSLGICYVTYVVISHVPYFPPRGQMSTTTQAPSAPGQR